MAIATNTQLIDPLLKKIHNPKVVKQFEQRRAVYNELMQGEGEDTNSLGTALQMYVRESPSNGWRPEAGRFPTPVAPEHVQARVRYTRYRRSMAVTDDVMAHMGKPELFIRKFSEWSALQTDSALKETNRQLYGVGTGEVAVRSATVDSGTTVTFRKVIGDSHGSRKILIGGRYQFFTAAGVQKVAGGATVSVCTAVSRPNKTATFDAIPTDLADGDILVYEDSFNNAIRGFKYHYSNGSEVYQTIPRDVYDVLKAVIVPAASQKISVALFSRLDHEMWYSVEDPDGVSGFYLSSPAQHYLYELLGHSMKRASMTDKTWDGGYKDVKYNDKRWLVDVDCDHDRIYKVPKEYLKKYQLQGFRVFDDDGKVLRLRPGFDSSGAGTHLGEWLVYYSMEVDLGCTCPAALGAITGLSFAGAPTGDLK